MDIKEDEIDIKDEVPTTSLFYNDSGQDVDGNVASVGYQKRNWKRGEIEYDFKYIGNDIKSEIGDEFLMYIKEEEIDIKDEVPTTSSFHSVSDQDVEDNVPSHSYQKPNHKRREVEYDFKPVKSDIIKQEIEDEFLMDIKEEEIDIKDEIPTSSSFHNDSDQDVDDNVASVSHQKLNWKRGSHAREKPFVCALCDYKCAQKTNLTIHMRTHTGEKPFACGLCDFKSAQKSNLTSHMRSHTGEKPFVCDLCNYKSTLKANLTIHMRSHTGEKPFICNLCDFRSAQKAHLTIHMRSHTGEKPFACDLCDFKAAWKASLRVHMHSHTGEKPFVCGVCEYKSAYKGNLTIHMRSHSEEKPFVCGFCDYKCTRKDHLVIHMKRHTPR